MKKMILSIALLAGIGAIGFGEHETWFQAGGAFGYYHVSESDLGNSFMMSPGVNLGFYTIFRHINLGIFLNWGILFPLGNDFDEYDPQEQLDFILAGVASTFSINENLKLYYGIGPNVNFLLIKSDYEGIIEKGKHESASYLTGLGLGIDAGVKYNVNETVCVSAGVMLSGSFIAHRDKKEMVKMDDGTERPKSVHIWETVWGTGYWMAGVKGYIAVGMHFY